jgi:hypothetical protein
MFGLSVNEGSDIIYYLACSKMEDTSHFFVGTDKERVYLLKNDDFSDETIQELHTLFRDILITYLKAYDIKLSGNIVRI